MVVERGPQGLWSHAWEALSTVSDTQWTVRAVLIPNMHSILFCFISLPVLDFLKLKKKKFTYIFPDENRILWWWCKIKGFFLTLAWPTPTISIRATSMCK